MKIAKFAASLAALGAALALSAPASATVRIFDLNFYPDHDDTDFSGSLGSIKVDDFGGTGLVTVTVDLNSNVYFQLPGDGLWWDLANGANVGLTSPGTAITSPTNGDVEPGDSVFAFRPYSATGAYRATSGLLGGFHYGISFTDGANPKDYYGGANDLVFNLTAAGLSAASFTGQSETAGAVTKTVFFGADLRQCFGTGGGPTAAPCATGPVGAVERIIVPPTGGGVPEPAAWAMMIAGFGGVGAMMRRRRALAA